MCAPYESNYSTKLNGVALLSRSLCRSHAGNRVVQVEAKALPIAKSTALKWRLPEERRPMTWQEIARQVSEEQESDKVTELANDPIKALDLAAKPSEPPQADAVQPPEPKST